MQIKLEHLTKRFGDTVAVNDLSITLESGKLIALLGPSGCGKTTTLNMISGILPVSGGSIFFDDRDVTSLPPEKRGIGLVFQNYALYPHMTVLQNICFPMEIQRIPKKERIRRAGDKIKSESPTTTQDLDIGFRVLKLDDTNMKDVYYAPDDYDQGMLAALESNIKDDRTDLDLLFGCLIDWGLPLSLPYKSEQIDGCTVHTYNDGDLIACFDANIPESVVKEIAQRKPLRAVFRDSGFASSPEKINVFEIFKLYMPEDAGDISKRVRVI